MYDSFTRTLCQLCPHRVNFCDNSCVLVNQSLVVNGMPSVDHSFNRHWTMSKQPSLMPFLSSMHPTAFFLFRHFLFAFSGYDKRRGITYSPGSPSRPILGDLLDIPKEAPRITNATMSTLPGFYSFCQTILCLRVRVFVQVVVVLCSLSAVKDLLEKRGDACTDRPTLSIAEITEMK